MKNAIFRFLMFCFFIIRPFYTYPQSEYDNQKVYTIVERMPEYPGGEDAMMNYIATNLNYPMDARLKGIQGKVFVSFIVDTTGKVIDAKVIKGIGNGLDEEAIRVINTMPDWKPGQQMGKKVAVQFSIPINFTIRGNSEAPQQSLNEGFKKADPYDEGTFLLKQNKPSDAIKYFDEAIAKDSLDRDAFFNRGISNHYINRNESACEDWAFAYLLYADSSTANLLCKYCSCELNFQEIHFNKNSISKITKPTYGSGDKDLSKFISQNIIYPEFAKSRKIEGTVSVKFIVDKNGNIKAIKIIHGVEELLDREALRVVKSLQHFTPASFNGKNMEYPLTVPVIFALDIDESEK